MITTRVYEVKAKSILTPSQTLLKHYSLNPYVGCSFGCRYCYASYMTRYREYKEHWGSFVEVKINAPALLERELGRKRPGSIQMSTVCDPYQPIEKRYELTRSCLEIMAKLPYRSQYFPLYIVTKSPLVLRDLDLIKRIPNVVVGFSIGTDNERIRRLFEPYSPPLQARLNALKILKKEGIRTFALVAPALPMVPERLSEMLRGLVDRVYVDCMNYVWKSKKVYLQNHLEKFLTSEFCQYVKEVFMSEFS